MPYYTIYIQTYPDIVLKDCHANNITGTFHFQKKNCCIGHLDTLGTNKSNAKGRKWGNDVKTHEKNSRSK